MLPAMGNTPDLDDRLRASAFGYLDRLVTSSGGLVTQELWLPERPEDRPSPEFLEWHRQVAFLG